MTDSNVVWPLSLMLGGDQPSGEPLFDFAEIKRCKAAMRGEEPEPDPQDPYEVAKRLNTPFLLSGDARPLARALKLAERVIAEGRNAGACRKAARKVRQIYDKELPYRGLNSFASALEDAAGEKS